MKEFCFLDDTLLVESAVHRIQSPASDLTSSSLFLLYHELRPTPSAYSYVTQTSLFKDHVRLFQAPRPTGGLRPEITFDDGHLSNLTEALPVLLENHASARFFITAGWTGKKTGFMDPGHLRQLHAAGQQIGAHGLTHKLLTHCSPVELDQELRVAKLTLENILGVPVTTMSLPGGRFTQAVLEACWETGFTHVFTSAPRAETMPLARCVGRLNLRGDTAVAWLGDLLNPSTGILLRLERANHVKVAARRVLGDTLYQRLWSLINREEASAPDQEGSGV